MTTFDESLTSYGMDVYAKKIPGEVGDTFIFWIDKKLEKEPSPWLYLLKGLFLEANKQLAEAEGMYQKAIEIADSTNKDIFRNRIKEMQKQLYNK